MPVPHTGLRSMERYACLRLGCRDSAEPAGASPPSPLRRVAAGGLSHGGSLSVRHLPRFGHHSGITSSDGAAASIFDSYWDIPHQSHGVGEPGALADSFTRSALEEEARASSGNGFYASTKVTQVG